MITDREYNKQVAEINRHYHKLWVSGAELKIKARLVQLKKYENRLEEVKEDVTRLVEGEMDQQFKRPSDKDITLERFINNLNKYHHLIEKMKRELIIFRKHLPTEGDDGGSTDTGAVEDKVAL